MNEPELSICNRCFKSNEDSCIENLDDNEIPDDFIAKNCRELLHRKTVIDKDFAEKRYRTAMDKLKEIEPDTYYKLLDVLDSEKKENKNIRSFTKATVVKAVEDYEKAYRRNK